MPLWTATTIDRFSQNGETDFVVDNPCIVKRVALSIVSGTSEYTLSDDVLSIRRITFLGTKLDPLTQRNQREIFQAATQQGKPFWYVFNNIGQNKIKLFPCPNQTIASTASNLYGSEIANRCIVDYYQAPDFSTAIIPSYIRRRLLKAYVLKMCFSIEGEGQNLSNAKYFDGKWTLYKNMYAQLLQDLHDKPRKLTLNTISSSQIYPAPPMLPIDRFGVSVGNEE